jgi:D-glycerate 3-kinase
MSGPIPELLREIVDAIRVRIPHRPALIGVGGAQGSGKSTQSRAFAQASGGRIAHFSLDDVYLTRAAREHLAEMLHPLLLTRGPPGSHDLGLADLTIETLSNAAQDQKTPLPRFDKAHDDRAPEAAWPLFTGQPEAILVDGWCMGALPMDSESATAPINVLEASEDPDAIWRRHTLSQLADDYASFFDQFDEILYLQAPSFEIIRTWRGEQEEEMLGRAMTRQEAAALGRFIQHYERVTRAMLAGHHRAGWIVHLDEERGVQRIERRA